MAGVVGVVAVCAAGLQRRRNRLREPSASLQLPQLLVPNLLSVCICPALGGTTDRLFFLLAGLATGSLVSIGIVLRQRAGLAALRRENTRLKQRMERAPSNG